MSKYTTQLRFICESLAGYSESQGYGKMEDVIQTAIPKIFDFDFPVYEESYRNVLCTKILKHFYLREIGGETYGQWKMWLNTRLNEIMPYYNMLYKQWGEDFDIFANTNLKTSRNIEHDDTTTGENTQNDLEKYSDTPQGSLTGLENDEYLTSASAKKTETDLNQKFTSTEDYIETIKGKNGGDTYLELFIKYKNEMLNIDTMILNDLDDLFIQLW